MSHLLQGLGVSPGVVLGPAFRVAPRLPLPKDVDIDDPDVAHQQVLAALAVVVKDLQLRSEGAGETVTDILTAHVMILSDPVLIDRIRGYLDKGMGRCAAVEAAFDEFKAALAEGGDYFAERIADLDDLEYRICGELLGLPAPPPTQPDHPCVLVARDLGPADVVGLDSTLILAIVTEDGGLTSHTAIVAKSLGLPAIVACAGALRVVDETLVLVDGRSGTLMVEPDADRAEAALSQERQRLSLLAGSRGAGRTKDGTAVQLLVNIDASYQSAAEADAEGVGLFRTEFLYLDQATPPSLHDQIAIYRNVFTAFSGRKVVIRTLDAGADKPLGFVDQGEEPNPALGMRGLRVARRNPDLLNVQLQAIAAATAGSDAEVWVMAPMVSTVGEARDFATLARSNGLERVGVMVEVPALALRARGVLDHCDFISIGTNDLSQYAFAADRMLTGLGDLIDPWQPALLELVRLTAKAGELTGRPVGVCGEAAADPLLALVLVGLGVRSLSMSPISLPEVRESLGAHDIDTCRMLGEAALAAEDGVDARAAVRRLLIGS